MWCRQQSRTSPSDTRQQCTSTRLKEQEAAHTIHDVERWTTTTTTTAIMTPLATCQLWNLLKMWAIRDDSRSVQQRRTSSYHMTMPRTPPLGWETRSTGFVHCSPVHLRILPAHTPGTSGTTGSDQGDISESDHHECNPHVNAHHCQRLVNGCHMASTSTGGEMGWGQCHLNPKP